MSEGKLGSRSGPVVRCSRQREEDLHHDGTLAREELRETFGIGLTNAAEIPSELDAVVATMWNEGWNPQSGNIGLFAGKFGVVLVESILELCGGELIFREDANDNHCSIFWAESKLEAFPFHKTIKCMLEHEGKSMAYFVRSLAAMSRQTPK